MLPSTLYLTVKTHLPFMTLVLFPFNVAIEGTGAPPLRLPTLHGWWFDGAYAPGQQFYYKEGPNFDCLPDPSTYATRRWYSVSSAKKEISQPGGAPS